MYLATEISFPSWWANESNLIVIDCGIDESVRSNNKLLVVSAIIGQTSTMRKFANAWAKDLQDFNVDFFHAKDHWNRRAKPYHGLSMTKRSKLLKRLIGHIHKYVEVGISVAVNVDEYERITTPRFRSNWGAPFAFSIQMLMVLAHLDLKDRNRDREKANVLVEQGAHIHQALEIIGKAKHSPYAFVRIASAGWGEKTGNPILQAADLLAYSWGEYLTTNRNSSFMQGLAERKPHRFPCLPLNTDLVERLKSDINAHIERRRKLRPGLKVLLRMPEQKA